MSSLIINNKTCNSIHFTGIFGSGMSALAQYCRWQGIAVSGSDRLLNSQDTDLIKRSLLQMDCTIVEQNGSGVSAKTDFVCVSTAIEDSNPDIASAHAFNTPIIHRSDLLAAIVALSKSIAVAGTSGKSTVTAMIFEFLSHCGKSPSLISGAALRRLERDGLIGNAFKGTSDLLVVEADESDGTLVKYHPEITVLLNVSKDHKPIDETIGLFKTICDQSGWVITNRDDPLLSQLTVNEYFGSGENTQLHPDSIKLGSLSTSFSIDTIEFTLPLPGAHNISNCLAALTVCTHLGCTLGELAVAVRNYEGVARRFAICETKRGATVVDDFAHNPEKIRAAVTAARGLSKNLHVIYQPHGFGPTRFLRDEYVSVFKHIMTKEDTLYLLPIYYAGGTAKKDISSSDLIEQMGVIPFSAIAPSDRKEILDNIYLTVKNGECVLLMGARDPSLSSFVKQIIETLDR